MIHYNLNWMGPINTDWIKQYGQGWAAGRIDCRGKGLDPYGEELSVPPMKQEDWYRMADWLWEFTTEKLLTLEQLVEIYEQTNPPITWLKEQ